MDISPLLSASMAIQLHVAAAVAAFAVGVVQFTVRRGTPTHRAIGWSWIALMAAVALSSFFIHEVRLIGLWSPIHLLSIVTLVTLVTAIQAIRQRNIRKHRYSMISLFALALVGTGAFTLLPGRLMHAVMFGG